MKLSTKVILAVGISLLCSVIPLYLISRDFVLESFADLEKKELQTNVSRLRGAVEEELRSLESIGRDWGAWNDTRDFIQNGNPSYIQSNLTSTALAGIRLHFMAFLNHSGRVVYAKGVDAANNKDASFPEDLLLLIEKHPELLQQNGSEDGRTGLVLLPRRAALLAVWPVTNSQGAGPACGSLLMGRFIDQKDVAEMGNRLHLSASLLRLDNPGNLTVWERNHLQGLLQRTYHGEVLSHPENAKTISGYGQIRDLFGKPSAILKIQAPRDLMQQGVASAEFLKLVLIAAVILLIFSLLLALESIVLKPILQLSRHVAKMKQTKDLRMRLGTTSRDEIGSLGREFDGMVESLRRETESRLQAEEQKKKLELELLNAQKMDALGKLAGGIAHDFNNLLHVISGNLELVRHEPGHASSRSTKCIDSIAQAADRAGLLVRQLLAFSNQQDLEKKELDVNEAIAGMLKLLRRIIGEDISLHFHPSEEPVRILANPGQFDQILMNLCLNARDAMPQGGKLSIEATRCHIDESYCKYHPWAREGHYALLMVSDNGAGIPAEIQSRIYEPFFTTKEVGAGTGLGLATVFGIVQKHEGLIHLYSEEGEGTTFRVFLPEVEPGSLQEEQSAEERIPIQKGREAILVAEDDELVQALVEDILCSHGYQVILAKDGMQAISLVEDETVNFALALLDVIMPKANGRQVFDRIRALRPNLPVIFCSGYSRNILDSLSACDMSNLQVLSKPYRPAELLSAIREMLDNSGNGQPEKEIRLPA